MDMNIQKYQALLMTLEYGSFSKAAQVLNYSQSGISRMINDLEKEWGIVLLERSRSGVKLTSDGAIILPQITKVVKAYNDLQLEIQNINGLKSGFIRIGTFSSVATHWLPKIIKEFKKDYPAIEFELLLGDYTEITEWISTGRVDCGFLRSDYSTNFESFVLHNDELMAVVPKNHRLAGYPKIPLKEISQEPFILLEKGGKSEISGLFDQYTLIPNIKITTWDDYAVLSLIEKNLGVSILPKLILQRIPYDVVIKSLDINASREITFVLRSKEASSLAVKKFIEYLKFRD